MNKEQLLALRQQITDTLSPLILDGDGSPEERVDFLMNIVRLGNADQAIYAKTFETINQLQDVSQKTNLLLELLSEVESDIALSDAVVLPVEDVVIEAQVDTEHNDGSQDNEQRDHQQEHHDDQYEHHDQ
jgi:hypothetical protein